MQAGRESSRAQRDNTRVFIARKDNSQVIAVGHIVDKQSIYSYYTSHLVYKIISQIYKLIIVSGDLNSKFTL